MGLAKQNMKMEKLWFINGKMENLIKISQKMIGINISTNNHNRSLLHYLNQNKNGIITHKMNLINLKHQ